MDKFFARLHLIYKALLELGPKQIGLYGLYRLGLRSGYFRWRTSTTEPLAKQGSDKYALRPVLELPERRELEHILGENGAVELLHQADEILAGRVSLYGGETQALNLKPPEPARHWTAYELATSQEADLDVKDVWEPARFGWAYTLGRAYHLSGDERYAAAFWAYTLEFANANPPYMGLNWASAQEAALRLIALVFAAQVFAGSRHSSPERMQQLGWLVASHARRIPLTLVYARAQDNNHLLSEAAGLFTAGLALPGHPDSARWLSSGWRWFNQGLQSQVQEHGAYTQHSTNYHRLMLQLALWVAAIGWRRQIEISSAVLEKLRAATRWLIALLDPLSGSVPNLGPNDGAYILPLTVCPFADYRPVLQAAAQVFLGEGVVSAGQWDEMTAWLGPQGMNAAQPAAGALLERRSGSADPLVLLNQRSESWAYLRAAKFASRPGHADQLHLDLWWRGMNIAQDAGTYLYNASKPWDNSLTRTAIHNTLTVNGLDQMLPAGRFLWLDWADGRALAQEEAAGEGTTRLAAEHNGYRQLGLTHRRSVEAEREGDWIIEDSLIFSNPRRARRHLPVSVRVHWLAPDWPWRIEQTDELVIFWLESCYGWIRLTIQLEELLQGEARAENVILVGLEEGDSSVATLPQNDGLGKQVPIRLASQNDGLGKQAPMRLIPLVARAGEKLSGDGEAQPTWGWVSPCYGMKTPALSLSVKTIVTEPIRLVSTWHLV